MGKSQSSTKRVELSVHTNMSAMEGIDPPEAYIDKALLDELPAIAITDRASVQAFPRAYEKVKQTGGIKLIYGTELQYQRGEKTYFLSILAKNQKGLKTLYQVLSNAFPLQENTPPLVLLDQLETCRENLLIGVNLMGEPIDAVLDGKDDSQLENLLSFYDYLLLPPLGYFGRHGGWDTSALIRIYERILKLCARMGKTVAASDSPYFVYSESGQCRKIIRYSEGDRDFAKQPNQRFRTTAQMLREFAFLPKEKAFEIVVKNSNAIANQIDDTFPPFPQEKRYPHIEQGEEKMQKAAWAEAEKRYGAPLPQPMRRRLEWELKGITKNGYATCYLIAQALVNAAAEKGYLTGSRGAAPSSFVAFLLGITQINPLAAHYYCPSCHSIEFHPEKFCGADLPDKPCPQCGAALKKDGFSIPAETFLGVDGEKEPQFNINFAQACQEEGFSLLTELFGAQRVAREGYVRSITYRKARQMVEQYCKKEDLHYSDSVELELKNTIADVKRGFSVHPGSVLITPEHTDVYDYTPLQYSYEPGMPRGTHFGYMDLKDALWEISLLSHDDPTMLHKLQQLTGLDPGDIPLDDTMALALFETGRTLGIPEFSYPFVREEIIPAAPPKSFDDLIRISGLSHGTDTWLANAQTLIQKEKKRLAEVISCRDDVMCTLLQYGYDRREAFRISQQVQSGKRLSKETWESMKKRNVPDWYIQSCKKIKYSFPRAHAAAYILFAYRIAYYKVHHPLAFYCAYFSLNADLVEPELLTIRPRALKEKIARDQKEEPIVWPRLELLLLWEEMLDAGYEFDADGVTQKTGFSDFTIQNGKIKPIQA